MDRLDRKAGKVRARSAIIGSVPVGPSQRRYANAAVVLDSDLKPRRLLERLQEIEQRFGRRRMGQRWRARVLDLDIVLWSGGIHASPGLAIPHPLFRDRGFVIGPAAAIAPRWRDPVGGLSLRQLDARLTRPRPTPR